MDEKLVRIQLPLWLQSYKEIRARQRKCIENLRELSASLRQSQKMSGNRTSVLRALVEYRKLMDFHTSLSLPGNARLRFDDEESSFWKPYKTSTRTHGHHYHNPNVTDSTRILPPINQKLRYKSNVQQQTTQRNPQSRLIGRKRKLSNTPRAVYDKADEDEDPEEENTTLLPLISAATPVLNVRAAKIKRGKPTRTFPSREDKWINFYLSPNTNVMGNNQGKTQE